MFEVRHGGLPVTTFPQRSESQIQKDLDDQLTPLLVNSDPLACNEHLLAFLKLVVDHLKDHLETYHACLVYALQLLTLNLFLKNFGLCLGKILGLLSALSCPVPGDNESEALHLKEILSIILLLLLKLHGDEGCDLSSHVDDADLFRALKQLGLVRVVANFVLGHIERSDATHASYVLLKLNCDVIFQYLYHVVLLTDEEFLSLTELPLIPGLITGLLSNDNFNNYELGLSDFEDETKLIAYEEFKLLLLINEQYMMKSLSSKSADNKVFDGLLAQRKDSVNGICGFTNLLVYHMNREELHIIKILMLKFLYLIFTSSYSAKLLYLNDVKILVDIFIRELNDNSYSSESNGDGGLLAFTYLKVLYPMLSFSELSDLSPEYKACELIEVLRNVVVNCDIGSSDNDDDSFANQDVEKLAQASSIVKAAVKCLSIPWLKRAGSRAVTPKLMHNPDASQDSISLALNSNLHSKMSKLKLEATGSDQSSDSLTFTRVASVRSSSKSDFHKHTTLHNLKETIEEENIFEANNHNVFLATTTSGNIIEPKLSVGLLDLPKEYLRDKRLPPLPKDARRRSGKSRSDTASRSSHGSKTSNGSGGSTSNSRSRPRSGSKSERSENHRSREGRTSVNEKGKLKKAPPPPPPPPRRRK